MKKNSIRIISSVLAAMLLLTSAGVSALAENETVTENNKQAEETVITPDTSEKGYLNYISKYADAEYSEKAVKTDISNENLIFEVNIENSGLYGLGLTYKVTDKNGLNPELGIKIDGEYPFDEASRLTYPTMWIDETENRVDGMGNQFAAKQIPYTGECYNEAIDISGWSDEAYKVYLEAGKHSVEIVKVNETFETVAFTFSDVKMPSKYKAPSDKSEYYKGEPVILEAEKTKLKSSYWLSGKNDNSTPKITPHSVKKSYVNYIGGGNWKAPGETITWETPELKAGYYQLGLSFRQSVVLGGNTYRKLTVDGKLPFSEAASMKFKYDYDWQQSFWSDESGKPYLIYLSEGKHTIGLTAVPGEISEIRDILKDSVADLSKLYIDITMITGEKADPYRDYELFKQVPNMESRLNKILKSLKKADKELKNLTGVDSGAQSSVIKSMIQVIEQMLHNKFTAHRYKGMYYEKYCAVASELNEMRDMPLDLDKMVLAPVGQDKPFEKVGFGTKVSFSIQKFFVSFVQDYDSISESGKSKREVKVWVNWGRDQAQVLNSMAKASFNKDIGVNIQLVNASIVQAKLSGKGPDVILQYSRSEPVNLAMRGVLTDLKQFKDCDKVLENFQPGAEKPYYYKDGLYALPDTQSFYLMFYRKDILNEMGIEVPETWEDFIEVAKLLARRNLTAWIPNKPLTDTAQVNAGIGSINLFPTLLMQRGLEVYKDNGKQTNLSDPRVMVAFSDWTDFYRKLKIPIALDFYNRFRTGTCPIGIETYTTYTTLKAAAPEIDGLWDVSVIPGTENEDGTVTHLTSGGGTGCAIMKDAQDVDAAWEFLKWWVSEETQISFSNEVEALLGPTGRIAVSNIEAIKRMNWSGNTLNTILDSWKQVKEIPEYPGSYYVSRSIYQSFWNVVEGNQSPKDMLLKYGKEADLEIERKWKQYENR